MYSTPKKYLSYIFYIVVLIVILFLFLSYFLPLLSYQEARRAVIIQESFLNQSLLPTYNGIPYFTKPPLHIWISLPFYGLGILFKNELFGMRLLSILSYIFIAYVIYLIHKKEREKTLLSLLILFSSFRFLSFIYRLDIEPLFILFNLTSFYYLLKYIENPSTLRA
ncbi:MAG: ArnT family glycosyltransferase, partial [Caldimicrobium sp.]